MVRSSAAFGATGLTSYAISAVDCALWDLKGKILKRPVYELLGGPQKEKIFCYAFRFRSGMVYGAGIQSHKNSSHRGGPEHGIEGLRKLEELVATTRETIGDKVDLMLDSWTGFI